MAGFLFVIGICLSIAALPFAWYAQFKLEERFGFNTTTLKTWMLDRVKGFLLALLFGYPLLALVLKLIEWTSANWWLWAAAVVIGFQLLLLLIAPAMWRLPQSHGWHVSNGFMTHLVSSLEEA